MTPMQKARAALAALPKCTATSRPTRLPCELAGTAVGGKCCCHGGASTERPPTHGRTTKKAKLQRNCILEMLAGVVATQGGKLKWFKPGRLWPPCGCTLTYNGLVHSESG